MITTGKNQFLVQLNDGIQLLVTDHGLPYAQRYTAEVYSVDERSCGSLGTSGTRIDDADSESFNDLGRQGRAERFAAEYDQRILKAMAASAGK